MSTVTRDSSRNTCGEREKVAAATPVLTLLHASPITPTLVHTHKQPSALTLLLSPVKEVLPDPWATESARTLTPDDDFPGTCQENQKCFS